MGRKVVCKICRKKGNTDTFYKVTDDKGKNKYYCSKEEYDNYIQEKENRYNLMKYIAEDILDYEDGQIVPPVMVKRISKLNDFYDFEVIHKCFEQEKDTIQYWIGAKNFTSEFGMASYVMKIIEGSINDVYNAWKHQQRQLEKQESNNIDFDIMNDTTTKTTTTKSDNILDFLEEEDM